MLEKERSKETLLEKEVVRSHCLRRRQGFVTVGEK